jgi:hypothetical protein
MQMTMRDTTGRPTWRFYLGSLIAFLLFVFVTVDRLKQGSISARHAEAVRRSQFVVNNIGIGSSGAYEIYGSHALDSRYAATILISPTTWEHCHNLLKGKKKAKVVWVSETSDPLSSRGECK